MNEQRETATSLSSARFLRCGLIIDKIPWSRKDIWLVLGHIVHFFHCIPDFFCCLSKLPHKTRYIWGAAFSPPGIPQLHTAHYSLYCTFLISFPEQPSRRPLVIGLQKRMQRLETSPRSPLLRCRGQHANLGLWTPCPVLFLPHWAASLPASWASHPKWKVPLQFCPEFFSNNFRIIFLQLEHLSKEEN